MVKVSFTAYGHHNITATHRTTLELTCENFLTPTGTCIVGIQSSMSLRSFADDIRSLAQSENTQIRLRMMAEGYMEEVTGYGSPNLTYADDTSMVIRKSTYTCDRTLMVSADKAAKDLDREFVGCIKSDDIKIKCNLEFTTL